jgi:hypothetical protein
MVTDYDNNSLTVQWGVLASVEAGAATAAGFPTRPGGYLGLTYGTLHLFIFFSRLIVFFLFHLRLSCGIISHCVGIAVTALLLSLLLILALIGYVLYNWKARDGGFPSVCPAFDLMSLPLTHYFLSIILWLFP